jgi:hypothetical protein
MTNPPTPPSNDTAQTETFEKQLEAKVLLGLELAIKNAVMAQQQLYDVGTAALAQELSDRFGKRENASKPEVSESQSITLAELAKQFQFASNPGELSLKEDINANPASTVSALMTAFSQALAMLNAVNVQHMLGYILVALSAELEFEKDPGPIAAKLWEDLLTKDQLAQFLVAFNTAEKAFYSNPAKPGPQDTAET